MFKKIALIAVLVIVAVLAALVLVAGLAYASPRPGTIHVQRAAKINAPPEKIFPLINDFHSWSSWSPWEKLDPTMKRTHSGAQSGKGAVYEWEGNAKVGTGRMEIVDATPPS